VVSIAGAALALGVVAVLATGGRGQHIVAAADAALVQRSVDMGLKLGDVSLQGASPQACADILKAAALSRGAPLLTLDLDAVRRRVEKVGWVRSARVIRLLPNTVEIAIQERRLIAVWEHAGHAQVVDADGVAAHEADPAHFSHLPLVVGEGANTAAAAILPVVFSRPRLAERLEALVRVDDRRWDLRLKDGSLIQLPAEDEEAALIRLDQLDQKARILELGFSRVDLRDPEMVAVRPRGAAAKVVADGAG
jgi:cell division protein FtsQ